MFEKNLSCEIRVVFVLFSVLFLLSLLIGKFFAVIGLLITAFVAITGSCMATKMIAPAFCKKSVTDALSKAGDEIKSAADDAVDTIKGKVTKK